MKTSRRTNHAAIERQRQQLSEQSQRQSLIKDFNSGSGILQYSQQQQAVVVTNYAIRTYEMTWRSINLGTTVPGSVNVPIEGRYTDVESDQIEGRADSIPKGVIPGDDLTMELQSTDMDSIIGNLLRDQVEVIVNGVAQSAGLGFKARNSEDVAGQLRYHPVGVEASDTTNDILIHRAFPKIAFTLTGERDQEQRLAVTFTSLPDGNQALGFQYGRFGSPFIVAATPEFVSIVSDQNINRAPYMTELISNLSPGEVSRKTATATFMTAGTITLEVVGAPTATDTSIVFDALSSNQAIQAGDFLKHSGGERISVEAVTYTTDTSGTLTVVRGVPDGVGSPMVDNDVITQQVDVSSRFVRDSAAWASSVAANVIVGNTFAGSGDTAKGILTHGGSAGASNIEATVNAVTSAALVVTST